MGKNHCYPYKVYVLGVNKEKLKEKKDAPYLRCIKSGRKGTTF